MSELLSIKRSAAMLVAAGGLTLSAACGEAVNDRVVPGLDCSKKPEATTSMTFHGVPIGEVILLGNPHADRSGLDSDVEVRMTQDGQISAEDKSSGDDAAAIQPGDEGVSVVTGGETYLVTAVPQEDGNFNVTVNGHCTDAPQGLGDVSPSSLPRLF